MATTKARAFQQGATIYREGDSADVAFIVASGRVELSRTRDGETTVVRMARTGQVFGESGMVEGGIREDTARALGPVEVEVLDRKAFLKTVRAKPEMALDVVGLLGQKLRAADEATRQAKTKVPGPTIVQRLIGAAGFGRAAQGQAPNKLDVRVAGFAGDDDGKLLKHVTAVLDGVKGVRVRPLARTFDVSERAGPRAYRTVEAQVRRAAGETACDAVVWGEAGDDGPAAVRFTSRATGDPAGAGLFRPIDLLPMPADTDGATDALLAAAAVACAVPADATRRALQNRAFQGVLRPAIEAVKALPLDLTKRERAQAHVTFAHVAAHAALRADGQTAHDMAALARQAYQNALDALAQEGVDELRAHVRKALGALLVARSAVEPERALLDAAIEHLDAACDSIDRGEAAADWAACQELLGTALYRIDKAGDGTDGDVLRESLGAYQNALMVFTRRDTPQKWASLQTSIARVAQILGKHLHNPALIERAVEACEQALSVRSRQRTPGLWASTQNNLGTALFLLAEMTGRDAAYAYAAEAFRSALSVYRTRGPVRMVAVIERNLARVEARMAPPAEDRAPGLIDWSEIGAAAEVRGPDDDAPAETRLLGFERAAAG